jgi:hypothetical protein
LRFDEGDVQPCLNQSASCSEARNSASNEGVRVHRCRPLVAWLFFFDNDDAVVIERVAV